MLVHRAPGDAENELTRKAYTNFTWGAKRALSTAVDYPSMLQ